MISGHLGGDDPLLFTTIWGDQPAGKVVVNCPGSSTDVFGNIMLIAMI